MATNDRSATAGSAKRAGSPMTKMRRCLRQHGTRQQTFGGRRKPNSLLVGLGEVDRLFEAGDPLHPLG